MRFSLYRPELGRRPSIVDSLLFRSEVIIVGVGAVAAFATTGGWFSAARSAPSNGENLFECEYNSNGRCCLGKIQNQLKSQKGVKEQRHCWCVWLEEQATFAAICIWQCLYSEWCSHLPNSTSIAHVPCPGLARMRPMVSACSGWTLKGDHSIMMTALICCQGHGPLEWQEKRTLAR